MPDLLGRGVDDDLLQALNKRAGDKGRSPIQNLAFSRALTIGELRRGVELIRHRGDQPQALLLEQWLVEVLQAYGDRVLVFDGDAAQIWGRLRVPNPHNAIDKQIAAIALLHNLTVVTRNTDDFAGCGVRLT
jgi:hypothetical protein